MSKKAIAKIDLLMKDDPSNEQIIELVTTLSNDNEPTIRTIASRFSKMKSYLSKNFTVDDKTLKQLRPPDELTESIIHQNTVMRNSKKEIEFSQADVDEILKLKFSKSPFEQAIFLELVSGRRISELFENPMRIDKSNGKIVKMQLNKTQKKKFEPFSLLKDANILNLEFKPMVMKLRSSVNGMSLNDFNKRVNRSLKDINKDLTSHDLRAMYAVYRYHTDNPEDQILTGYISKVLNHSDTSDAGINYSAMKFTG